MAKSEVSLIPKTWTEFPEAIRVRLGREAGPQRAIVEEGHLLLILHHVPEAQATQRRAALFWRMPSGEWKSTAETIPALLKGFDEKIADLDQRENLAVTAVAYHAVLEELAPVLRTSRGLHRALQQARELVKGDRDLINCRDQAASLERAAELLLQDAQFGLDFIAARNAETQAREAKNQAGAQHRLNLLAALFLPISTLASVYGMSVRLPGSESPGAFWMILGVGAMLGLGIAWLLTRKQG
ncbi:MAG: magnesium transporter CorA family protein [Verrucomicrobiaceae bacterium]|nr:magnesium transporter CorA family protein [Verrucomicrobiaceae bacterium]